MLMAVRSDSINKAQTGADPDMSTVLNAGIDEHALDAEKHVLKEWVAGKTLVNDFVLFLKDSPPNKDPD
eukprot:7896760-Alexandrium_andersonii.AAC.1